ncbi:MAG: cell division protein FtsL [Bacteroidetes bacterium]|nr:cell division protein FtsL [Bacteroidota bacterium]
MKRFTRKRLQPTLSALAQDVPLEYVQAAPRRRRLKGLTTFNIVMMLIAFAVLITFYISNVVMVDSLMMEAIELDRQEQILLQERENLRAEINTLASYSRIQRIAVEDLGLVHANQQPFSLTVFNLAVEPDDN